jgi:hypothetical protein
LGISSLALSSTLIPALAVLASLSSRPMPCLPSLPSLPFSRQNLYGEVRRLCSTFFFLLTPAAYLGSPADDCVALGTILCPPYRIVL